MLVKRITKMRHGFPSLPHRIFQWLTNNNLYFASTTSTQSLSWVSRGMGFTSACS